MDMALIYRELLYYDDSLLVKERSMIRFSMYGLLRSENSYPVSLAESGPHESRNICTLYARSYNSSI